MVREKYSWFPLAAAAALLVVLSVGVTVRGQGAPTGVVASELLAALKAEGQIIYSRECASCHGADGQGDGAGPALNGDMALANKELVIKRILEGEPKGGMDPFAKVLTDRQIAAVGSLVRNAWENAYGVVLEADVKPIRDEIEKAKKK